MDRPDVSPSDGGPAAPALRRALKAYADALHLSCLAAGRPAHDPARAVLADRAVAAHVAARELAEEAVRHATHR